MPIKPSAFKSLRQSKKRAQRNERRRRAVKELSRKTGQAVASKQPAASDLMKKTYQAIDKAAQKRALHKRTAARKKQRLMKKFNAAFQRSVA